MSKYNTFINILDVLRKEAPEGYKFYHPLESDFNKLNDARSRAFVHLFLKVKFGLLSFEEREKYVTDGPNDAGIDGYYIDDENKIIYFLQAKFRTNSENFQSREIKYEELINMDIDRVTEGQTEYEHGVKYNSKIQKLIQEFQNIPDMGRYKYEIVIMANTKDVSQNKLKKLADGNRVSEFNYNKCYNELIFPIVSGTFYNSSELSIFLNLEDKNSEDISYSVETEFKDCEISVLFVPTIEIAKTLHKYKNSILKYNPRSYLDMAKGTVNAEIANTIVSKKTNEFALFNNGITALSDETNLNKKIGKIGVGQLILKNPQIINGGQTAYTLSLLYQDVLDGKLDKDIFDKKEVLLKVITFSEESNESNGSKLGLIEAISKATNQQTAVSEADRRSNDKVQLELQELIFKEFGLFYQRKAGEFGEGLRHNYIKRNQIIDRELMLRLILANNGQPSQARSRGTKTLFKKSNFDNTLNNSSKGKEYVFAYQVYSELNNVQGKFRKETNNKDGIVNFGHALRYGKFAVVSVIMKKYEEYKNVSIEKIVETYLSRWINFEEYIIDLPTNKKYFREVTDPETQIKRQILNYDGYYKGTTINKQALEFEFE
ncbi:AIPR family protein [Aquimarina agarivorans]|uniref:AIPR family protein n=1 Tax=Aquimarina agarivorans TaxID=980584 RepID=UPI000248EAD8|nr:AIPR family protein [Aquimarina agarivorans]